MIDEHSRLCLAIRAGTPSTAKDVVAVLEELISVYPAPPFIRADKGLEFNAQALQVWCKASDTTSTAYIELGSRRENCFTESFNGRFQDEFLNTELLTTTPEARLLADRLRWEYNTFRPHSALQGRTPGDSSTRSYSMTTTTHSHKPGSIKGGRQLFLAGSAEWRGKICDRGRHRFGCILAADDDPDRPQRLMAR